MIQKAIRIEPQLPNPHLIFIWPSKNNRPYSSDFKFDPSKCICLKHNISISKHILTVNICNYSLFIIFLQREYALFIVRICKISIFGIHYTLSNNKFQNNGYQTHIPLEQGLRHCLAEHCVCSWVVRDHIPLKQGLRPHNGRPSTQLIRPRPIPLNKD